MDIEKLIEQLNDWNEKYISNLCGDRTIKCEEYCIKDDCLIVKAATALSMLQAESESLRVLVELGNTRAKDYRVMRDRAVKAEEENEKLRAELKKLRDELEQERDHRLYAEEHADLFLEDCKRLNVELEQVKDERDAAVESIPHECKTCVYHTVFFNGCTPDHDCTNPDGGCSNNCDRWKWRGRKED